MGRGCLVPRFNACPAIFTLFAFLSACGGGGGENSAGSTGASLEPLSTAATVISGSVGDGPITGATLKIFDRSGNLIQTEVSDNSAAYSARIKAKGNAYPLTIEVSGGIDMVTQREPDFGLTSVVVHPNVKIVNINPFTTLIVEAARSMPGGLNEENIASMQEAVLQQLNFGLDPMIVADPIATTIADDNVAVVVKASEALGEMIRRTVDSLQAEGLSVSADQVVEAISHDLIDGLMDGVGGANADIRITALATLTSAQVLVEALSNNLKVDGVVATAALDTAIRATHPSTPDSALTDSVRINREMIQQARTTIEAARALAPGIELSTIADTLADIQNNSLAIDVEAILPGDTSSDLDAVRTLAAGMPEQDLVVVTDVVRITAEGPTSEPQNSTPILSGTPDSSVAEDSAYAFQPSASDLDGDGLSFDVQNRPVWASFNKNTGRLSGRPRNAHVGVHTDIVITVSDGSAEASIGPFSILVSNTNDAPTISGSAPTSVTAGTAYTFRPNATDADGDSLTFSVSNRPSWISFDKNTGRLSGTPNNAHVGAYGNIAITVSDGTAIASLTGFDLTVTRLNSAPAANAGLDQIVTINSVVTLSGGGSSDADGDPLSYRWSLISQPNGGAVLLNNANSATASFTSSVNGDYTFRLVVNDGTVSSSPDSVTITTQDDTGGSKTIASPTPGGYAPTTIEVTDNFDNGVVANADVENSFWSVTENSNVTVRETNGTLSIDASGSATEKGRLLSKVSYRFNFFVQPLRFSLKGLSLNGDVANAREKQLQLTLTSTQQSQWAAPDALNLVLQGDGRVNLTWKTDLPGTDSQGENVLLDQTLPQVPTEMALTLDQTSYRLTASWAGGSYSVSGAHNIPVAQWGDRGDAALSVEGRRNAAQTDGTTARLKLDALEVVSLKFFDTFDNTQISDTGQRKDFWQIRSGAPDRVLESDGKLRITSAGTESAPGGHVVSPVSKDFNFFAQKLKFSAGITFGGNSNATDNVARFGLTSERKGTRDTASALALAVSADNRVRLGWKVKSPGTVTEQSNVLVNTLLAQRPTAFDLALSKTEYNLVLYWNGGSRTFSGTHGIKWYDWNQTGNAAVSLEGQRSSSLGSETAVARWDHLTVARNQEYYIAPTVFGPIGDSIELETPELDTSHSLAQWGLLDVTKPPFNADPSGQKDATQALQHAINFAREHHMVTFFPVGTYKVSNTLSCAQPLIMRTSNKILNDREGACVMLGSRAGAARPKLFLAPNSPGFDNPSKPRNVVHLWARSYNKTPQDPQPNISYNQMFINLDIEVGTGNSGAIGIRHRAAQGSSVQETSIDVTHGFAGIDGGAGSGGSHAGITVIGGQYGLYLLETQPAATITGITLTGQTKSAILYGGRQTLSAVGIKITVPTNTTGPAIKVKGRSAELGQVSLVDSEIRFESANADNLAIWTDSSIYLKNVYVKKAGKIVETPDGDRLTGNVNGWRRIKEYANGIQPPPYTTGGNTYQYEAPVYLNGVRNTQDIITLGANGVAPPTDLQAQHLWAANFPGWESPGAVNVKQSPYNAKGDGISDDTAAIQQAINDHEIVFLPKGYFRISSPLMLKPNTKLVGISRTLSNLIAQKGAAAYSDAANPQPIVRTANDADAQTVLAFLQIRAQVDVPGVYALHWRAGRNSVFRATNIHRHSEYGYAWVPGRKTPSDSANPLVYISGNGGGKWYNFNQGSSTYMAPKYRHILIDGTTEPLHFYQFNPEHAKGEANAEVRNAANVSFYGIKSESNYAVLWVSDSDFINVYGYGGNGAAFEYSTAYPAGQEQFTPTLFRVERTPNFRLVQLVDSPRVTGGHPVFGIGVDPYLWHMLLEVRPSTNTILSDVLDRPVLYKRGNP